MSLFPINQLDLYGLEKNLDEFVKLYKIDKLPNKIRYSNKLYEKK